IPHPRQACAEATGIAQLLMLVLYLLLHLLPLHPERWIGQAVVELLMGQLVVAQGIAELDVLGREALNQLIRHRDGIGLRVELLGIRNQACMWVPLCHLLNSGGEKTARTRSAVIDRSHHPFAVKRLMVGSEYQGSGKAHHIARSKKLT